MMGRGATARRLQISLVSERQDHNDGDHRDQRATDKGAGHCRFEGFVLLVGRENLNRGHHPEYADDIAEDCC